ncbi:MAG: hypothetical protein JRI59_09185 [Deltaproteobacteria bacterium]|nr:hypothetical protein [Deltaproteobacteria bacterium]
MQEDEVWVAVVAPAAVAAPAVAVALAGAEAAAAVSGWDPEGSASVRPAVTKYPIGWASPALRKNAPNAGR